MAAARKHIEEIRRTKFSIGGEPNPLTEDLHQAVKNLSAELYAKDVHFLMELIQNAEDNEYGEGVDPSLEFVITSKDITASGASSTLLVFNNEKGFSAKNIDSICSVGRSTKKGLRKQGYIGEKGIGFKSVFLITAHPYIFSNGYQIRFSEKPCSDCNVGYIVPEWVENNHPTISSLKSIYGTGSVLPTTTLVLPLKPDKVEPVKEQLSSLHPEVLLFLAKIKKLSVREDTQDPLLKTVNSISISSERDFVSRKNIHAESYTVHLSADEIGKKECGYYMWKQKFPVKPESKVVVRSEVEQWVLTLAFPIGKRLNRGGSSPGIYSFLPTETVTNFPFIIQADFLLASSRENILWDNKWNHGILECVPVAFLNAFNALVKSSDAAPVSSLPPMFRFLPIVDSSHAKLNNVRESIKEKVMGEPIVPCESYTGQKIFHKPCEVGRLKPEFWSILDKARKQGVSPTNISSHGRHIISSCFDISEFNAVLVFLEVKHVDDEWYAKCIQSSNLVMGVSEDVYVKILLFIADRWSSVFQKTNIKNIPLIKYASQGGNVSLFSINEVSQVGGKKIFMSTNSSDLSWLVSWNSVFISATNGFFFPKVTQEAIGPRSTLLAWLRDEVGMQVVDVFGYAKVLCEALGGNRKIVLAYAHFVYHSFVKNYLSEQDVVSLCNKMPLVDVYGCISKQRKGVIVPANGSRWVELIGSNPWRHEGYVELGEDYSCFVSYAGTTTPDGQLISFLKEYALALDVPDLPPPNVAIPTMSAPLTKQNVYLLLSWISNLRRLGTCLPERFLSSIKDGSWLKISLGSSNSDGYRPPSQSFMMDAPRGRLLQNGSLLVDIPLVDQKFYGDEIKKYKEEFKMLGVMFEDREACKYIGQHLMSLAASSALTRANVFSIVRFIRFLRNDYLSPPEDFIKSIKKGKWLRTTRGDMAPGESVLFGKEWSAASQISNIPFIDQNYYGSDLLSFRTELQLLGVSVDFGQDHYKLVAEYLKPAIDFGSLSADSVLLILQCIRNASSRDKLIRMLKEKKCIKTNLGYKNPSECFLFYPDSAWGCILQVFSSFPCIDEKFYGRHILSFENELKLLGVVVEFEEAAKVFASTFKQLASSSSIKKENVLLFLDCYRKLMKMKVEFPSDLKKCIRESKWLRTRLGDYRTPKECILYSAEYWKSISQICLLPFIDDSEKCFGKEIHDYKQELQVMGVVTELKSGANFVAASLYLPSDPSTIEPASVCALLKCIRSLQEGGKSFLDSIDRKKIAGKWLKTRFGYKTPDNCLLFDSDWSDYLRVDDGPFLDSEFYGSDILSYKMELNALGVVVDVQKGCQLLADYINHHSDFNTISRIYVCLCDLKWKNDDELDCKRIWIPGNNDNGVWASPKECVLYDNANLFGLQLNVLAKHYGVKLLAFFGNIFGVKVHPSVDDYCKLWKQWEGSGHCLSHDECCSFWEFVVSNWGPKIEETLAENLMKLPVHSIAGGISLLDKVDVFVADDLYLKDLFENSTSLPLFVWYPQSTMKSLPRAKLLEVFCKIGVRTLSESVLKHVSPMDGVKQEQVDPRTMLINMGLFKLILGFLADPELKIEAERRHKAVGYLLEATVLETTEPVTVEYSLSLSTGETINVTASQMMRWDRQNAKFVIMKKVDIYSGRKNAMEYAYRFSEVVAEGVLCDQNEELVPQLAELIRLGYLVEFDEAAVEFLTRKKNLQIFLEDREYLSTHFPLD